MQDQTKTLQKKSISTLNAYAKATGCSFEFDNGGTEILCIPPKCE